MSIKTTKNKKLLRSLISNIAKKDAVKVKTSLEELLRRKVKKKIAEKARLVSKKVFNS